MNWFERGFEAEARSAGARLDPFRAGLLFAREIAYPRLNPAEADEALAAFTAEIAPAVAAESETAGKAAVLSEYFFDRLGFGGNRDDYYDPANSYLNAVLDSRRGLPISLAVLFVELARRAGLPAAGVGMPGHFIVVVEPDSPSALYLDPFHSGAPLTPDDCARLVRVSTGYDGAFQRDWLNPTPPRAIVARMLNNLRGIYVRNETWCEADTAIRLLRALEPNVPEHARDLGLVLFQENQLRGAITMLEEYLRRKPDAPDFEQVRHSLALLGEHLGKLN